MTAAGLISQHRSRLTGTIISIFKAGPGNGLDNAGGDWVTVCENHGTICNHRTRKLAFWHAPYVSWCEPCQRKFYDE